MSLARFPKWLMFSLLAAIAGLSIWLPDRQAAKVPLPVSDGPGPDNFMENVVTRVFDAQGALRYQVQAERVAYYHDGQRSEFSAPSFVRRRADGQRWTVEAERGQSRDGTGRVLLQGDVVMRRSPGEQAPVDLEIRTRDVLIRPDEGYAETAAPAEIIRGASTLHSMGLKAYFEQGRVLLSQVRGHYAP